MYSQILTRINQYYHDDFLEVAQTRLQPDEGIVWAGNITSLTSSQYHYYRFGYLLVTSYRLIVVYFHIEPGIFGVGRETIITEEKYPFPGKRNDDAIALPSSPLREKEKRSRIISEATFQDVSRVDRSDIKIKGQKQATLVVLYVHLYPDDALGAGSMLFYSIQDGQEVYNILQNAIRSRDLQAQTVPDIADQLAKLAKLYQDKAITKEEYEAAKRKLLG